MKKFFGLIGALVLMLVFSSCNKGKPIVLLGDRDDGLANTRMEELCDAIKYKDSVALKKMFSEKAIEQAEEIDAQIENLLSFVKGNVVSWQQDDSTRVSETIEQGSKSKRLITWYHLDTDEQSYLVLLVDYPIDTIDSRNVGLYSIRILKSEDENKLVGYVEEWIVPGIYIL